MLFALSDSGEQRQMKKAKHQPINVQEMLSDDRRAISFSGVVPFMGAKKTELFKSVTSRIARRNLNYYVIPNLLLPLLLSELSKQFIYNVSTQATKSSIEIGYCSKKTSANTFKKWLKTRHTFSRIAPNFVWEQLMNHFCLSLKYKNRSTNQMSSGERQDAGTLYLLNISKINYKRLKILTRG